MKRTVCLAAMVAAMMGMMAQNTYEKVTAAPEDWEGTYLIVCEEQGVVFNGAADEANIDAKSGPAILQGITFAGGSLTGTEALDAAVFSISATEDENWTWAIQSASGLYIGHKDSVVADNGLSAETELKNKCKHTLSIDENGNFIATPRYELGGAYNLQYNKKSDQMRFRYFVPGDKKAVQLYRLQGGTTGLQETEANGRSIKKVENGQLVIVKNGQRYNILGKAL